ncbi:FAD-dependent oxidoreductase [Streptomyces sp. NPDC052107]|uniref:FAD-dependent oxidoreductase n=1 Tax=Streptomyces sp. NPDC052107 TaxID=3155632 RepID=UPI00341EED71
MRSLPGRSRGHPRKTNGWTSPVGLLHDDAQAADRHHSVTDSPAAPKRTRPAGRPLQGSGPLCSSAFRAAPASADVVIVGGGVMGASTAFHLAEGGVTNVVVVPGFLYATQRRPVPPRRRHPPRSARGVSTDGSRGVTDNASHGARIPTTHSV